MGIGSVTGTQSARAVSPTGAAKSAPTEVIVVNAKLFGDANTQAMAGRQLRITFGDDPSSFGWTRDRMPASSLELRYRTDGGAWKTSKMSKLPPGVNDGGRAISGQCLITVPKATKSSFEYYFQVVPQGGDTKIVTRDRVPFQNFNLPVVPASSSKIAFGKDLGNPEGQTIKAGTTFTLEYDLKRMKQLFPTTHGNRPLPEREAHPLPQSPAADILWQVQAHVRFLDANNRVISEKEYGLRSSKTTLIKPEVYAPQTATRMEVWFTTQLQGEAAQYPAEYGISASKMPRDSDYDSNFTFPVQK